MGHPPVLLGVVISQGSCCIDTNVLKSGHLWASGHRNLASDILQSVPSIQEYSLCTPNFFNCPQGSTIVIWRKLGDEEGKLLGNVDTNERLLDEVCLTISEGKNNVNNVASATQS